MSSWTDRALRESYDRHGARGPTARGDYQINCPFCEDRVGKVDDKFKLSINPGVAHPSEPGLRGGWICWRCDARGWGGVEFLEVREEKKPGDYYLGLPHGFVPFNGNEDSLALAPYRDYLRRRGSDLLGLVAKLGGGGCVAGYFEGRVLVPHSVGGKAAGFVARSIGGREPKYLYPRGMDRRSALWGLHFLPPDSEPVYVVEGVFDALALFPYGLATFGKTVTPEQMDALVALRRPIVVCLDGDAWLECRSLAMRLRMRGAATRWAYLPPARDPGSLGWAVKEFVRDL